MPFQLQPAFILHSRPYRDTSLIVDILTEDFGRCGAVARGARKPGRRKALPLQLCQPLLLSCSGRGELLTLTQVESHGVAFSLVGDRLYSAMYLNELLTRLLPPQDACPEIFHLYQATLEVLTGDTHLEVALRHFEQQLLQQLGYGLELLYTYANEPIAAEEKYRYSPDFGLQTVLPGDHLGNEFLGADLLAIASDDYSSPQTLSAAKRLMRSALNALLGDKPLKSRELFLKR